MWNLINRWPHNPGRRPLRRRVNSLRVRGKFETLEARSLLSASYGDFETLPSDLRVEARPELHVVAIVIVAESPAPLAAKFFAQMVSAEGDAPWENLSHYRPQRDRNLPLGLHGGVLTQRFPTDDQSLLEGGSTPDEHGQFAEDFGGATTSGVVNGSLGNGALAAHFPGGDSALGAQDNGPKSWLLGVPSRPPLPPVAGGVLNYLTAFAAESSTASPADARFGESSLAREAAFDDYSADSLLMASDADADDKLGEEDELKGEPEEKQAEDQGTTSPSMFDEAAQTALDALARERRALDAVLAALHDIALPERERVNSHAQSYERRESSQAGTDETWTGGIDSTLAAAPAYDVDGGMVLLESSGDANSNAYDLTAVVIADLERGDGDAVGVETALGMYQAIDVGMSEPGGATRDAQGIAKPAATAPASVSAENAPAKKSGQPAA